MFNVSLFTTSLATLTVLAQVLTGLGTVVLLSPRLRRQLLPQLKQRLTANHFLIAAYIVALIATIGSLTYSDVAGYTPCKLCWYQRILMYPQVVLYLVALVIKDKAIAYYAIALSVIGALLAGYHYLLQMGIITTSACATVGFSVSCSENFGATFGYITIPMMSLSAFLLIIVIWLLKLKLYDQS
jgi:disulfide bond formation protein DsbB